MARHTLVVFRWLIGAVALAAALIFNHPVFADPPAHRSNLGTFNDSTTPDNSDGGSITVVSGDTIIIAYWFRQAAVTATVSTVTFGAQSATPLCTVYNDGAVTSRSGVEIWGLLAPTAGTAAVTVTTSANVSQSNVLVHAYTDVFGFGPLQSGTAPSSSTNWDDSITTTERNSTIFARGVLTNGTADPFTPDDTEVERAEGDTGPEDTNNGAYQDVDLVATSVGTYNLGGSSDPAVSARWAACAIELLAFEDNRLRMIGPGMMR